MKHYDPPDDINNGSTLHGLVYQVKPWTPWGNYRALGWMDHTTPWWDAQLFQELLYKDTGVRRDLAQLALMEWSEVGQSKLRKSIILVFTRDYKRQAGIAGDSEEEAFFGEARKHLIEHAQTIAEWCMYEYSRFPYEWGLERPREDITKYIPPDLWAKDISRVAKKIAAGVEIETDRVRKNEYDYSTPTVQVAPPTRTTGKKFVGDRRAYMTPEQLAKLEEEEKRKQQLAAEEAEAAAEEAEAERLLARRERMIEKYATEATLEQRDDKPNDDLLIELPWTAGEIRSKASGLLERAALRKASKSLPSKEGNPGDGRADRNPPRTGRKRFDETQQEQQQTS